MYLAYFLLTVVVEALIAGVITRDARFVLATVCMNAMSHPLAYTAVGHGYNFWWAEAGVMALEIAIIVIIFPSQKWRNALIILLANIVTAAIGTVV